MEAVSDQPLPLSAAQAMAFHQASEDRNSYIADQPWPVRMRRGFEESVPLPGCPYCWADAAEVQWHVLAHELWTVIRSCGHWFTTELPITVKRTGYGWETWEEWTP